jgi:hypothetical protein
VSQGPLDTASVTPIMLLPDDGALTPGDNIPMFRAGDPVPLSRAVYGGEVKGRDFIIYGAGSVIPTGVVGNIYWPFPIRITGVTLSSNESGSVVIDIWKVLRGALPAVDGNSIVAADPPTIVAAYESQDLALTGWTTAVAADSILVFNVDSAIGFLELTLTLNYVRTG